jgi:hypothetical protein
MYQVFLIFCKLRADTAPEVLLFKTVYMLYRFFQATICINTQKTISYKSGVTISL